MLNWRKKKKKRMQSLFLPLSILSLPLSPYLLLCTICIVLCVQSEGVLSVLHCEAGKLWLCVCVCVTFLCMCSQPSQSLSAHYLTWWMERVPLNNAQPGTPGTLQLALSNGHSGGGTLGNTGESCVGVPAVISVAMLPGSVRPPPATWLPGGCHGHFWADMVG